LTSFYFIHGRITVMYSQVATMGVGPVLFTILFAATLVIGEDFRESRFEVTTTANKVPVNTDVLLTVRLLDEQDGKLLNRVDGTILIIMEHVSQDGTATSTQKSVELNSGKVSVPIGFTAASNVTISAARPEGSFSEPFSNEVIVEWSAGKTTIIQLGALVSNAIVAGSETTISVRAEDSFGNFAVDESRSIKVTTSSESSGAAQSIVMVPMVEGRCSLEVGGHQSGDFTVTVSFDDAEVVFHPQLAIEQKFTITPGMQKFHVTVSVVGGRIAACR
jgi:hypothetical protein